MNREPTSRVKASGHAADRARSHRWGPRFGWTINRRPRCGRDDLKGRGAIMSDADIAEEELNDLVRQTEQAAAALISGDIRRYFTLTKHADDFTLLAPFGGEPRHGSDTSKEALEAMAQFFRGGEASLELVQSYTSGDLAVLVLIERLHGEVGGMPDQDLSLRVTLVYRRDRQQWRLVHRHADPLVHGISLERLAALARGD